MLSEAVFLGRHHIEDVEIQILIDWLTKKKAEIEKDFPGRTIIVEKDSNPNMPFINVCVLLPTDSLSDNTYNK